jgi:competence protein ComEC
MLRLLLPFISGVLLYAITEKVQLVALIFLVVCLLCFLFNEFTSHIFRKQWIGGIILLLALLSIGYVQAHIHNALTHKDHYSHHSNNKYYSGTIQDIVVNEKFTRLVFNVDQVMDASGIRKSARGRIMTYLYDIPDSISVSPGMRLTCYGFPSRPPVASIPDAFDYRNYLKNKSIYDLMFLRGGTYQLIASNQFSIKTYAAKIRQQLINNIDESTGGGEAATVIAAMVLGERSGISTDTRDVFTNTGAVHVLAVSGLHVGIVFLFIQHVLGLIPLFKGRLMIMKLILVLLGIWSYAFLTGLAPSVIRSGIMMSLFAIGMNLQRKSRSVNTLAASAFIMLLINPLLIYQIGFQFSYLAVLGIILFQRHIENLLYIPYRIPAFLWKLISVSLAAQLTVSPLSIYYFNQFPLSFVVSSAVVVLLAYIILVTVLSGLILYPILSVMGDFLIQFAALIVDGELIILRWLNGFPSLLLDKLWIAPFIIVCIYVFLLLLANINSLSVKWVRWSLLTSFSLGIIALIWHASINKTSNRLYICNDDKIPFLLWQRGNSAGYISPDSCHVEGILNNTMKWRSRNDITDFYTPPLEISQNIDIRNKVINIDDARIIFIRKALVLEDSMTIDYAVLQNNAWIEETEFSKLKGLEKVIITAGNKWSYQNYWKKYCNSNNVPFHNLRTDGYFEL